MGHFAQDALSLTPAFFASVIGSAMEMKAKWIWAESLLHTSNCYVYARKEFEAVTAPSAEAYVCCTGEYKLYVNGRYAGRGTNYGRNYDTHDLSHVIRPGKNVIGALCHIPGRAEHNDTPAGFLLQLEITRNGDGEQLILTDETWKVEPADEWDFGSAPIANPERYQEVYDSRNKPVGWNVVGFADDAWSEPAVREDSHIRLAPREIPQLRETDVTPKQIIESGTIVAVGAPGTDIAGRMYAEGTHPDTGVIKYPKEMLSRSGDTAIVGPGADSYVVLDFGAETLGYPSLKIRGGGPAVVDIGYSEALDCNGRVWPTRAGVPQADRLILHGGRQEWQVFGRRLFRYVQLTFRDVQSPIAVESVSAVAAGYPVEQVSTFECSDDMLNRIWQIGVDTLRLCMQDRYESRAGFAHENASDARLQALSNYYCFFDAALAAQALEQTSASEDARDRSGWIGMLHDYYRYTGDIGLVRQLYENLSALIGDMWEDKPRETAAHCALRCQALRDASKLAAAVFSTDDAALWHERSVDLMSMFNGRFWDEAKGLYCDGGETGESAQTSLLAVSLGLADLDRSCAILGRVPSEDVRERFDAAGRFCALSAMSRMDRMKQALDVIRDVGSRMLERGATSWWETCASDAVKEGSLCHGPSASPTYFLPAEVLGVKPSTAATSVVIQPRVGDLQWARGRIKTAAGFAHVEWRMEDGVLSVEIEAPPGFIVALPLGGFTDPMIDEIDLTPETPERRARKTYGWGTTIWRAGAEHDPYIDWLASQETEPPASYLSRERCALDGSYIWVRESISNHVRYEVRESQ